MTRLLATMGVASLMLSAVTSCNADDSASEGFASAPGCSAYPDCNQCATCFDQCMCHTGDTNRCNSDCGPPAQALPCNIENIVKARCQTCHGARLIGGAPMPLVSASDFQSTYTVRSTPQLAGQTLKLYELARIRINGEFGTLKMPQGNPLSLEDYGALTGWLGAGAPAGAACGPPPGTAGSSNLGAGGGTWVGAGGGTWVGAGGGMWVGSGGGTWVGSGGGTWVASGGGTWVGAGGGPDLPGAGGSGPTGSNIVRPTDPDVCAGNPTVFEPLVARPGETCYEFRSHGVSGATDTSKFSVQTGESYNQFYFDVPWPPGTLATRFGARFDNLAILHHWLGFSSASTAAHGTVMKNVTGTTLGENAELIGGWAVGGCNVEFGPDMGLKLPDRGKIMIQWHHYNNTGGPAEDGTAVQFCTVPPGGRPNVGGLTFLGTENFNGPIGMPPGQQNFSGTCTNDSGGPIVIKGYNPHMHLIGTNMKSVVTHLDGSQETVFDHTFLFDHQVNYFLGSDYVLQPGERITSTCTFNNSTGRNVAFGQSTTSEMCYQFTFAYPYGALNNGIISLIGATNTCW